jgi:hypothetical protein
VINLGRNQSQAVRPDLADGIGGELGQSESAPRRIITAFCRRAAARIYVTLMFKVVRIASGIRSECRAAWNGAWPQERANRSALHAGCTRAGVRFGEDIAIRSVWISLVERGVLDIFGQGWPAHVQISHPSTCLRLDLGSFVGCALRSPGEPI